VLELGGVGLSLARLRTARTTRESGKNQHDGGKKTKKNLNLRIHAVCDVVHGLGGG